MATSVAYADAYTNSISAVLAQRVEMSILNTAAAIYSEASATTGHVPRAQFASKCCNAQVNMAQLVRTVCAQGITATSTDAQIDTAVSSVWNLLAAA